MLALVVDEAPVVAAVVEALVVDEAPVVAAVVEALEVVEAADVSEVEEASGVPVVAPPPPAPPAPPAPSFVAASPQPIRTVVCNATTARPNDHFDPPSTPRSETLFIMSSKESSWMARH
ncbi:hypothetical protein [Sorangium sp. So ce1000]|uniref:hypothetical protein n=1 Tax=Sorangium sp. So ce1000 TaxID=3133325 RepID=UPI003F623D51